MKRRDLCLVGGRLAVSAFAANTISHDILLAQKALPSSHDALEQRVAGVLQAYDAQGNHRTGTEVDNASAEWLAAQARQRGAEASLEPFSLSRIPSRATCASMAGESIAYRCLMRPSLDQKECAVGWDLSAAMPRLVWQNRNRPRLQSRGSNSVTRS